jgi:hypothetical protein
MGTQDAFILKLNHEPDMVAAPAYSSSTWEAEA